MIEARSKKEFIKWFLKKHQLKRRESVWILNYLMNHSDILKQVHFTEDVKYCSNGILMSTNTSEDVPFRYYKAHLVTTDAEKAFNDIRVNRNEPVYIQLNFKDNMKTPEYLDILEENPFVPEDYHITSEDSKTADVLLNYLLLESKRDVLMKSIDEALDNRDKDKFDTLSIEYNEVIREVPEEEWRDLI